MGLTIIGPEEVDYPLTHIAPVVQVKQGWNGAWETVDQMQATACEVHVSGRDLDRAQIRWRYSEALMHPWQTAFAEVASIDALNLWCRIQAIDGFSEVGTTIFVGRFSGDDRTIYGSGANGPTGMQNLVAYGPLQILRKIEIDRSLWWDGGMEKTIGWVPPINNSNELRGVSGNRSFERGAGGAYLYEDQTGPDWYKWTYRQYLEYLLWNFVQQPGGPLWSIGGQAEVLDQMTDPIRLGGGESVATILRRLIPRELGVDYKIVPTVDSAFGLDVGFEVQVFALSAIGERFGDAVLPVNPNQVEVTTSQTLDNIQTRVAYSRDQTYNKIRVVGRRIVCCCSLFGSLVASRWEIDSSLVPRWLGALEDEYKAGDPTSKDPALNDVFRSQDIFRPVYQQYGAPVDWDHNGGMASPLLASDGSLFGVRAEYQNSVRSTLSWIPLREGWDYSTDPPTDDSASGLLPDFRPPAVWVYTDTFTDDDGENPFEDPEPRWVPIDALGIAVSVSRTDWGVFLSANPNHLLAKDHIAMDGDAIPWSETEPKYDYENMVATIAFETDQRLVLEKALPFSDNNDGVKVIKVPDAEFWFLAPFTFVNIDRDEPRGLLYSGTSGRVLRSDADRMAAIMAGAIARYRWERMRASITVKGIRPWAGLLGNVLTVIEDGGQWHHSILSPIDSVSWKFDKQITTTFKTGGAR